MAQHNKSLRVDWIKDQWHNHFDFFDINLNHAHFKELEGVYIIWYANSYSQAIAVRVGQGIIGERLSEHRENTDITNYRNNGDLLVSWAKVESKYRDGIEAFLGDALTPLVGDRFPKADPIIANLPWQRR